MLENNKSATPIKNNWLNKIRRTVTSILPIADKRSGNCIGCGRCCRLPNVCYFLRYKKSGKSYCLIYNIRPLNCRKYPRTKNEFITRETCGYNFK